MGLLLTPPSVAGVPAGVVVAAGWFEWLSPCEKNKFRRIDDFEGFFSGLGGSLRLFVVVLMGGESSCSGWPFVLIDDESPPAFPCGWVSAANEEDVGPVAG